MHFTTLSGLCGENFMSLGDSYSNYGTLDIVLGAMLMYRKVLKMLYTKIIALLTSFACIFWQEPPIEVQFALK